MNHVMNNARWLAVLTAASTLTLPSLASAQVAGSTTTVGVTVSEITQVASGWSARRNILGKVVYNDAGETIGTMDDLIVAPDKSVSYVIVGAGGFIGIGRHDVAFPVVQVQQKDGRFIIAHATKDAVKAMPSFDYAMDMSQHDEFVAKADQDVAKAKLKLGDLEKSAAAASAPAKAKFDSQVAGIKKDLRRAEDKIGDMNRAGVKRWREFEGEVSVATARLRKWFAGSAS